MGCRPARWRTWPELAPGFASLAVGDRKQIRARFHGEAWGRRLEQVQATEKASADARLEVARSMAAPGTSTGPGSLFNFASAFMAEQAAEQEAEQAAEQAAEDAGLVRTEFRQPAPRRRVVAASADTAQCAWLGESAAQSPAAAARSSLTPTPEVMPPLICNPGKHRNVPIIMGRLMEHARVENFTPEGVEPNRKWSWIGADGR